VFVGVNPRVFGLSHSYLFIVVLSVAMATRVSFISHLDR